MIDHGTVVGVFQSILAEITMTGLSAPLRLSSRDRRYYQRRLSSPEAIIRKCKKYGVPLAEIDQLTGFYKTVILFDKVKLGQTPKFKINEIWRLSIGAHLDRYAMPDGVEKHSKIWNAVKYRRWKLRRQGLHPLLGEADFTEQYMQRLRM